MIDANISGVADLVDSYLKYLELVRGDVQADDATWEEFHELSRSNPRVAWQLLLEVLERCAEEDVALVGAGVVQDLLYLHPELAPELESEIRSNDRFLRAFQYVAMTGVPLDVQRKLNAALADRGVDPKFLAEYDEEID